MPQEQSYREIQLSKNQIARVSPQDYEWLSELKWYALWNKFTRSYYAVHVIWIPTKQTTQSFYMQRMILGLERGDKRQADHIDHNTLNNTRANLRIATQQQNSFNMKLRCDNSSGYKGVYKEGRKDHGLGFNAYLFCMKKKIYIGKFPTAKLAHSARCERAKQLHGAFFRSS